MGNIISSIRTFQKPVIIDVTPGKETLPAPRSSFPPSLRWTAVWRGTVKRDFAHAIALMAN